MNIGLRNYISFPLLAMGLGMSLPSKAIAAMPTISVPKTSGGFPMNEENGVIIDRKGKKYKRNAKGTIRRIKA